MIHNEIHRKILEAAEECKWDDETIILHLTSFILKSTQPDIFDVWLNKIRTEEAVAENGPE